MNELVYGLITGMLFGFLFRKEGYCATTNR